MVRLTVLRKKLLDFIDEQHVVIYSRGFKHFTLHFKNGTEVLPEKCLIKLNISRYR